MDIVRAPFCVWNCGQHCLRRTCWHTHVLAKMYMHRTMRIMESLFDEFQEPLTEGDLPPEGVSGHCLWWSKARSPSSLIGYERVPNCNNKWWEYLLTCVSFTFLVIGRVGQNRISTPYMTIYLVIFLPKLPYIHHIYIYIWFWPILLIGIVLVLHVWLYIDTATQPATCQNRFHSTQDASQSV